MTREKRDHLAACLAFLLLCAIGVAAARSGWSGVAVLRASSSWAWERSFA